MTRMVMARPATAVGLRENRYHPRRQDSWRTARGGRSGAVVCASSAISRRPFQADARVQVPPQQVHGQVGDGEHQPYDQYDADDGVEVLLQHHAHPVTGDARPAEHGLDEERFAESEAKVRPTTVSAGISAGLSVYLNATRARGTPRASIARTCSFLET